MNIHTRSQPLPRASQRAEAEIRGWAVPPARDASLSLVSHRIPGVGDSEELVAVIGIDFAAAENCSLIGTGQTCPHSGSGKLDARVGRTANVARMIGR